MDGPSYLNQSPYPAQPYPAQYAMAQPPPGGYAQFQAVSPSAPSMAPMQLPMMAMPHYGTPSPQGALSAPYASGPNDISMFANLDSVYVKQQIEMLEVMTGFETENRYKVFSKLSPRNAVLLAKEHSSCCSRSCLGAARPFEMEIFSPVTQAQILRLVRPYKCCLSHMEVLDGSSALIGTVDQKLTCGARVLHILNKAGQQEFEIYGPCCSPWTFNVFLPRGADGAAGQEVGSIKKRWTNFAQELYTDADNFGCEFDMGLSVEQKALIFATVFLIDFLWFERDGHQR
eukprot:TRINITY_DN6479_c0_g2_i1.p1 TRINITY_DN6479_c0_g2~~TRINITY_DN6479_c0_g2_i1.p1  ORF type:complete len:287 (-),score=40.61 TRINITY_DN6479_c0_g2_i1:847-1707(-)